MSDGPVNGATAPQPQLHLNSPAQLATVLLIDNLLEHMKVVADQLGGFMKYPAAADLVVHAANKLMRDYNELRQQWGRVVQLATPETRAAIEGKKIQ